MSNEFGVTVSILRPVNGNILNICASDLLLRFSHLLCGLGDRSGVKDVKMGVVLQFQIL